MKLLLPFLVLLVILIAGTAYYNTSKEDSVNMVKDESVRHVVVFKYKPEATEAQIKVITDAFRALKDQIPGITGFEYGTNNSPEGLNQDFTHVYLLTFENAEARDTYLPHPKHAAFGEILQGSGIFDGAFVIDYVAMD
ncbi:MAG: Dabb family protein [Rhodothermales bacterium]